VGGERAVAALTADRCVRVRTPHLDDVTVALDAGGLTGEHDRSVLVLGESAGAVRSDAAVVARHEQDA
jgi:hypothetical protein